MTTFATIVATWQRVGATRSRLAKVRELSQCLQTLAQTEIQPGVLYLAGETLQGKIGVGYSLLKSASTGAAADTPSLTITAVDSQLAELATIRGAGSTQRRHAALHALFSRATEPEQEFLLRLMLGELRQGALAGVMLDAIAAASQLPVEAVRRASMYASHLGALAQAALTGGLAALDQFQLALMSPIAPMLAQTAADVEEALNVLAGDVAFDWKMDGARIQLHKLDRTIRIYTRGMNEVSAAIPEIVAAAQSLPVREIVLDGEAISFTRHGRPQPFQVTMRRFSRKLNVEALRAELPMQAFYFDCLRLDGVTLADRPARERFAALAGTVPIEQLIPRIATRSIVDAQTFYDDALAHGHEGVMAKALDSAYEAGNRGASWLKIKRAHTLDLVVLAAEWGHGRRTGLLSNLHLGALDADTGEYIMLGKTFKGLTDEILAWQTQEFLAREVSRDAYTVTVRPELVVEIAFSDLQASPRYPGGLALRLARVKAYRPDKSPAQADTMAAVRKIYAAQSGSEAEL
jgi:DNA ligase-1